MLTVNLLLGFKIGCVSDVRYQRFLEVRSILEEAMDSLKSIQKKAKDWGITTKNPHLKRLLFFLLVFLNEIVPSKENPSCLQRFNSINNY